MAKRAQPKSLPSRQRGIAIITAVFVVAMVAAAAASLSFGQQLWQRQIMNMQDHAQSASVRHSGLEWIAALLGEDAAASDTDDLTELWAQQLPPIPVEEGALTALIGDAQGRFNLNNLVQDDKPSGGHIEMFKRLLEVSQLDPNLSDAVVDWLDSNDQRHPYGAEDAEYLANDPPYRAANRPFQSIEELRLVRGFDSKAMDMLRDHLAVLPKSSAININTATGPVLAAMIRDLPVSMAQEMADEAKTKPFKNKSDLQSRLPDGYQPLNVDYDVKTEYFDVTVTTQFGRLMQTAQALIHRPQQGAATVLWQGRRILIQGITSDEPE